MSGYAAKGRLEFNPETATYRVAGHDSAEPRNPVDVSFTVADTGYAQDYEAGDNKNPENDGIFYPNVTNYLGELAGSGSIVLLHDASTVEQTRYDIEVQFDLRPRS